MDENKRTAKQAAVDVLGRADGPLKAREIAERVLKVKGVELKGKTPLATIAAILATENKKSDGLFVRTAPGTYALRVRRPISEPRDAAEARASGRGAGRETLD